MPHFPPIHDKERRKAPRFPARLEVELVFGQDRIGCETTNVSLYGAFIRTTHPVELDRAIRIRVRQGADDPIEWMGLVQRIVSPRKATDELPAGIGVEIFSIDEETWGRWSWLIAIVADRTEAIVGPRQERDSAPLAAVSPRRHARFATPVQVRIGSMPELVRFAARDISAGGMFLRPAPDVGIGDELELRLKHPLSGDGFELQGCVVRVESGGVALEFINLTKAVRVQLKRFIVTGRRPR